MILRKGALWLVWLAGAVIGARVVSWPAIAWMRIRRIYLRMWLREVIV